VTPTLIWSARPITGRQKAGIMTHGIEDNDNPVTTRRRPFSVARAQRIRGEGELIAHVGRAEGTHSDDLKLDLTAFLLGADDKVPFGDRAYCVFYNHHLSPDHSTRMVENEADGTEFVHVDLGKVDETVTKIVFAVTIYDADVLKHTFGTVTDARFWIEGEFANRTKLDLVHSDDLSALFGPHTAVVIGEVYRSGKFWDYRALGGGHTYPGLIEIGRAYGVRFDS
jgi:stress response protein SCP2